LVPEHIPIKPHRAGPRPSVLAWVLSLALLWSSPWGAALAAPPSAAESKGEGPITILDANFDHGTRVLTVTGINFNPDRPPTLRLERQVLKLERSDAETLVTAPCLRT
jgi:hypothetical protein